MLQLNDQLGHSLTFHDVPQRIVSLVPSQSEFLWDLGLEDKLCGVTRFCIHPEQMYKQVTRVGGTKDLNLDKIRALKPDLIIGNKEENSKEQIELLQKEFKVWMSDIFTLEDAYAMMLDLGRICNKSTEAQRLVETITRGMATIRGLFEFRTVAYFIWQNPYMVSASGTFVDQVLQHAGLSNAAAAYQRYPVVSTEALRQLKPEYCFLSSEPFPFKESHLIELQRLLPNSKCCLVDGEMFSWYGSRLLQLPAYLQALKANLIGGG